MLFVLHRYATKRPGITEHMGVKISPPLRAKHLEEPLTEKMKDKVLIPVTLKKEVIVEEPSAPQQVQKETNRIPKVRLMSFKQISCDEKVLSDI